MRTQWALSAAALIAAIGLALGMRYEITAIPVDNDRWAYLIDRWTGDTWLLHDGTSFRVTRK